MDIIVYSILGAILLSLAIVLITGFLNPDIDYVATTEIKRPLEEVFAYFDADENMPEWVSGFESFERIDPNGHKVGARSVLTIYSSGRRIEMSNTLKKYQPNERVIFTSESSSFSGEVRYQFYEVNKRSTKVVNINIMKGKGIFQKGMLALIKKGLRKQAEQDLTNLHNRLTA